MNESNPRLIIQETEAVPIALVLNELILNAVKHSNNECSVTIELAVHPEINKIEIVIINPGKLPVNFNSHRQGQSYTGLNLVISLLPRKSAKLDWQQQDNLVFTKHKSLQIFRRSSAKMLKFFSSDSLSILDK